MRYMMQTIPRFAGGGVGSACEKAVFRTFHSAGGIGRVATGEFAPVRSSQRAAAACGNAARISFTSARARRAASCARFASLSVVSLGAEPDAHPTRSKARRTYKHLIIVIFDSDLNACLCSIHCLNDLLKICQTFFTFSKRCAVLLRLAGDAKAHYVKQHPQAMFYMRIRLMMNMFEL